MVQVRIEYSHQAATFQVVEIHKNNTHAYFRVCILKVSIQKFILKMVFKFFHSCNDNSYVGVIAPHVNKIFIIFYA